MKIGVVVPTNIAEKRGGALNLIEGLLNYINTETEHNAEIIKLKFIDSNFWELIESYWRFLNFEASDFEIIVSTNAPGWLVNHENHICYMLHPIRGLYELYDRTSLPLKLRDYPQELELVINIIRSQEFPDKTIRQIYECLKRNRLLIAQHNLDAVPGPFVRELIQYFDQWGLRRVSKLASLSKTVKARQDYFPDNHPVKVVYPAPLLSGFYTGDNKYFFTASRLEPLKRIDLIIKAFKKTKTPKKLLIAGIGPDLGRLQNLAAGDNRIEFLGFVDSEELKNLYANSIAIMFTPYLEDYGYITIEAMMSRKPVITVVDSGGPTEFVIDKETGFLCKDIKGITNAIDQLANNTDLAIQIGENAYAKVKQINWANSFRKLFADYLIKPKLRVLMDEPLIELDPIYRDHFQITWKRLNQKYDLTKIAYETSEFDKKLSDLMLEQKMPKPLAYSNQAFKDYLNLTQYNKIIIVVDMTMGLMNLIQESPDVLFFVMESGEDYKLSNLKSVNLRHLKMLRKIADVLVIASTNARALVYRSSFTKYGIINVCPNNLSKIRSLIKTKTPRMNAV